MSLSECSYETLWLDQKIDIDRLHAVIEGKYKYDRRAGNTFGVFIRMIHEVLQGDPGNRYLCIGQTKIATEMYLIRPMYNILTAEGFTITPNRARRQLRIEDTDMTFTFTHPSHNFDEQFRGCMFSRVFQDLMPETEYQYMRELTLINLRNEEYRYG
jgi:hypothetical protein